MRKTPLDLELTLHGDKEPPEAPSIYPVRMPMAVRRNLTNLGNLKAVKMAGVPIRRPTVSLRIPGKAICFKLVILVRTSLMPEDDTFIDLGIRATFVVNARGDWRTNRDPDKISREVAIARNFLKSLPLLVYFSENEEARSRAKLTDRNLWTLDNTPSEDVIRRLAEGESPSLF